MNIYVSKEGLEKLKADLKEAAARLEATKKEKAVAYTASGDTWHDNPHFNKLQQDEQSQAVRVAELQRLISQAQVLSVTQRNQKQVRFGSIVELYRRRNQSDERTREVWEIVGYGETDTAARKVAYNAPLAHDILGSAPGDIIEGEAVDGHVEYEIVALYANWESVPSD